MYVYIYLNSIELKITRVFHMCVKANFFYSLRLNIIEMSRPMCDKINMHSTREEYKSCR